MGTSSGTSSLWRVVTTLTLAFLGINSAEGATFQVTNASDSGPGTLRDAIDQSNSNGESDTITFNFGATTTIGLTGPLPPLTEGGTVINGGDTIILDGSLVTDRGIGFAITSANNAIENMIIVNFPGLSYWNRRHRSPA